MVNGFIQFGFAGYRLNFGKGLPVQALDFNLGAKTQIVSKLIGQSKIQTLDERIVTRNRQGLTEEIQALSAGIVHQLIVDHTTELLLKHGHTVVFENQSGWHHSGPKTRHFDVLTKVFECFVDSGLVIFRDKTQG